MCNIKLNEIDLGFGGGYMLQYANRDHFQMMGYLIETPEGKTVMIDGGSLDGKDAEYMYDLLSKRGKKVDLWIITHAHDDHFGALSGLLKNKDNFDIDIGEMYFYFPPTEWIATVEDGTSFKPVTEFLERLDNCGIKYKKLNKGDVYTVGGLSIDVLKECGEYRKYKGINNTSAVLKVHFPKRDVLFLGDLGETAGNELLEEVPHELLRCDIVQMAHHGQNGVNKSFYEVVKPKICLYCAPEWLWENVGKNGKGTGPFNTLKTRAWMEELGVEISCPHAYGDYKFI